MSLRSLTNNTMVNHEFCADATKIIFNCSIFENFRAGYRGARADSDKQLEYAVTVLREAGGRTIKMYIENK
jgi:hypothetical protein